MAIPPTGRLVAESERLRERVEALERLAAENRLAEAARRESEGRWRQEEAERRRWATELLARAVHELGEAGGLRAVLRGVVDAVRARCPADVVTLAVRRPGAGALRVRQWTALPGLTPSSLPLSAASGVGARVLESGEAFQSDDCASDPRLARAEWAAVPVAALVAAPLRVGARIEGLLAVGSRTPAAFTEAEGAIVQGLADHAALALQAGRQRRRGRRRDAALAAVHGIARAAATAATPEAFLLALREQLARVLDARHMLVLRRRQDGTFETMLAVVGGEPAEAGRNGAGAAEWALGSGRPLRTANYLATCRRAGVAPSAFAAGLPHAAALPLVAGGQPIGVLALWSLDRAFSRADERLLTTAAALTALVLREPPPPGA